MIFLIYFLVILVNIFYVKCDDDEDDKFSDL